MPHAVDLENGDLFLITQSIDSLCPHYDETVGHLLKIVEVDAYEVYWNIRREDGSSVWDSDGYINDTNTLYDDAIDREYFDVVIRELGLQKYQRSPTWEV